MRIVIFSNSSWSIVNFRTEFILALIDLGFEVHIFSPSELNKPSGLDNLVKKGVVFHSVRVERASSNPFVDLRLFLSVYMLFRKLKPSIVFCYTVKPIIWGGLAAHLCGVPKIFSLVTGLGYAFSENSGGSLAKFLIANVVSLLYRVSLKNSTHVFFQNPDDKNLFLRQRILGSNASCSVVNGSGVNLHTFFRTRLPSRLRFLMVSRLLVDKGVFEYVEAAQLVKAEFPWVEFALAGPVDENPESVSEADIAKWKVDGSILYLGELADVRPAIEAASVVVLPSYREGVPRSILEGMAMGRAVITADSPGCRETVEQFVNGILVPIKSVGSLADAMRFFVQNEGQIQRMGAESYEIARREFDVNNVNAIMLRTMGLLC